MPQKSRGVLVTAAFILTVLAPDALASKTVTSPGVAAGQSALEWKGEYVVDDDGRRDGAWKEKLVASHGFTPFWQSEIEAIAAHGGAPGADTELTNIEWKNKIRFARPGAYWIDTAMRVSYSLNTAGDADNIEIKLIGAKEFTRSGHRGNLIFSRDVGEDADNAVEWGLSWSSRYKCSDGFQPGFELHSDFGEIGNEGKFDDQDHRLGPVFYGALGKRVSYDAGYLFGISDGAPDGTVKAIFKYKW